jgi:hypothetical protein
MNFAKNVRAPAIIPVHNGGRACIHLRAGGTKCTRMIVVLKSLLGALAPTPDDSLALDPVRRPYCGLFGQRAIPNRVRTRAQYPAAAQQGCGDRTEIVFAGGEDATVSGGRD